MIKIIDNPIEFVEQCRALKTISQKRMDDISASLCLKSQHWLHEFQSLLISEYDVSDNSDPHKMSILYILHAYFVRASADSQIIIEILSTSWTDTMEKIINCLCSSKLDSKTFYSLGKLITKWKNLKIFSEEALIKWQHLIDGLNGKSLNVSVSNNNYTVAVSIGLKSSDTSLGKRDVPKLSEGAAADDSIQDGEQDQAAPQLKRRKESFSMSSFSDAHTTVSACSPAVMPIPPLPLPTSTSSIQQPLHYSNTAAIAVSSSSNTTEQPTSSVEASIIKRNSSDTKLPKSDKYGGGDGGSSHVSIDSGMLTLPKANSSSSFSSSSNSGNLKDATDISLKDGGGGGGGGGNALRECAQKAGQLLHKILYSKLFTAQSDQQLERERPDSYFLHRLLTAHTILSAHSVMWNFLRSCKGSPPALETLPAIVIASLFLAGKAEYYFCKVEKLLLISNDPIEECFSSEPRYKPTKEEVCSVESRILRHCQYAVVLDWNPIVILHRLLDEKKIDRPMMLKALPWIVGENSPFLRTYRSFTECFPEQAAVTALIIALSEKYYYKDKDKTKAMALTFFSYFPSVSKQEVLVLLSKAKKKSIVETATESIINTAHKLCCWVVASSTDQIPLHMTSIA